MRFSLILFTSLGDRLYCAWPWDLYLQFKALLAILRRTLLRRFRLNIARSFSIGSDVVLPRIKP